PGSRRWQDSEPWTRLPARWAPPGAQTTSPPTPQTNWAECVRIIGTVALDHGPAAAAFRSEADNGAVGEVIISIRQIERDSPMVEVECRTPRPSPPGWSRRRRGRPG